MATLRAGVYPSTRHDRGPWRPSDIAHGRQSMAGESFGFVACCLFLKGDWAEFSHTVGLPSWNATISPLCCFVEPAMMYSASELLPLGSAAKPQGLESYTAACARCEVKVMLTGHQIRQVEQNLIYDKSKQGVRGRALSKVRVVCCKFESLSLRSPGSFCSRVGLGYRPCLG